MSWQKDLQSLQKEADGMMDLFIVRQVDAPALLKKAIAGDREAVSLMGAVNTALAQVKSAPKRSPTVCGCCTRQLRKVDFSIVLAVPRRDDPMRCIFLGVCTICASEPDAIREKAMAALSSIWPDARPIDIPTSHGVGHA